MTSVPDHHEPSARRPWSSAEEALRSQVRGVLEHAVDAFRKRLKVYESLRNLNEVVGTEYGDRVVYELIQNAHDAHRPYDRGRIAVRLVVRSEADGTLYVANGGSGFRSEDVDAIKNLATTAKKVGEGIGNKGLGFRSTEAVTDDVRIFSRGSNESIGFDGYCFRFATVQEIENRLCDDGVDTDTARAVAVTIPRYLVPVPLTEQPDDAVSFARRGYSTVIVAPLRTTQAIALAKEQVQTLTDPDAPVLLFLDRIAEFRIDIQTPEAPIHRRVLTRREKTIGDVPGVAGCRLYEVGVGEDRRFLVVRREIDKELVLDAVKRSVSRAPQIKTWLEWKGQPIVSVAVGVSRGAVTTGRLYNFLPMGTAAEAPLLGHLDAPFFASIDRRTADLDLPLNASLMQAAAEACAYSAVYIAGRAHSAVPQRAVFDLVAWTGEHAGKLESALEDMGNPLEDAAVIPTIAPGGAPWASLSEVHVWPEGRFSLMKAAEVVKRTGARLVSAHLDEGRLNRLEALAERQWLCLSPSGEQLAVWSECFARSLVERNAASRTWSRFYEDLMRVFDAVGEKLDALAGKAILLDRSQRLRPAGGVDAASEARVFVRRESSTRSRAKGGVPLPPPTLSRRLWFLDQKVALRPNTLNALVEAKLVREYDPVEALTAIGSALERRASDARRWEALTWAFSVWRATSGGVHDALRAARLQVRTVSGWRLATGAAFSASWTPIGLTLENFLVEASDVSLDCRRARNTLLCGFGDWRLGVGGTKRQWVDFLTVLGVTDGLRPVAGRTTRSDWGFVWQRLFSEGDAKEGLDQDWCSEALHTFIRHPGTAYRRKGSAWRLPGQVEHEELSETAKEALCELALRHIEAHSTNYLTFRIGRFERTPGRWDAHTLPTPLATFLRSKPWIAAEAAHESGFSKPSECWAARRKQDRPPRFVNRVRDTVAVLVEANEGLADQVFGDDLGLLEWRNTRSAPERLRTLAAAVPVLPPHDRPGFRREYRRAWLDLLKADIGLPQGLDLAVDREGGLVILDGDAETLPTVIVTKDAQAPEARILSSAGHAVLDVGDASGDKVVERLTKAGRFTPRLLQGGGVQLLVDGEPFVPRVGDPPLVSLELEWLPEVVLLGHEILAKQLELGVQRATIERRVRAIRVRWCQTITLVVDSDEVAPRGSMEWHGVEDPELPTLILVDRGPITWPTLAGDLARTIEQLVDTRLEFLDPFLSRLALRQDANTLEAPDDESLARALRCDARTLHDHRAALRTDLGHVLYLLTPVVAYFANVATARQLRSDAARSGVAFDVHQWLQSRLSLPELTPQELIETCGRASDRAILRKELDLDYERFNRVLQDLDESPLSNEAELRSVYEAYVRQMRSHVLERLRRHHAADFREGHDLAVYVKRKTLAFLEFDSEWILTRETLDNDTVEAHVARLLDAILGEDHGTDLPPYRNLIEKNRKSVRDFASSATSTVRVWCRRHRISVPEPWHSEDPQSVMRFLEDRGLLDFESVGAQMPALCQRAACWPAGMPETLEHSSLGLDEATVEQEEERRRKENERKIIERRSIDFAGTKLDTAAPSFAGAFRQLAQNSIASNDTWLQRSGRPRLAEFAEPGGGRSSGGGPGGGGSYRTPPPEEKRQAMGLASEWLAFQYLQRHHGEAVDETCWISGNRSRFFGGHEGDDAAGYDFCVTMPHREWLYEVKSSLEDTREFELTPNEMRVAASTSRRSRRQYRILYVPFVFSPDRWHVLELPNPMGEGAGHRFKHVGRGSIRFRFEHSKHTVS